MVKVVVYLIICQLALVAVLGVSFMNQGNQIKKLQSDLDVADYQGQKLLVENTILKQYKAVLVEVTVYDPVKEQTDSISEVIATDEHVGTDTIAVSRELEQYLLMGSRVQIGDRVYVVRGRLNQKVKGMQIDIYSRDMTCFKKCGMVLVPFRFNE